MAYSLTTHADAQVASGTVKLEWTGERTAQLPGDWSQVRDCSNPLAQFAGRGPEATGITSQGQPINIGRVCNTVDHKLELSWTDAANANVAFFFLQVILDAPAP